MKKVHISDFNNFKVRDLQPCLEKKEYSIVDLIKKGD